MATPYIRRATYSALLVQFVQQYLDLTVEYSAPWSA